MASAALQSTPMNSRIQNRWLDQRQVQVAHILHHETCPEGLDFVRARFSQAASYELPLDHGALVSVLAGKLMLSTSEYSELHLDAGTHLFLPPGSQARFHAEPGAELLHACAPSPERTRGSRLLIRSDAFLQGCAAPGHALRWILTPQYLSRRAFLHHDKTLLSPRGVPLSWFHTTMFDAQGLPTNDEGRPVFKMSYNYRTEPNVCYDVQGKAQIRVAKHPYGAEQLWGPWQELTSESTYHLCEDEVVEWAKDGHPRRNKHEVNIEHGYVSLICMHNPGCTGNERHSSGEYSEYGDLEKVVGTPGHREHLARIAPLDEMVDVLSLAQARGSDPTTLALWSRYQDGLSSQRALEEQLLQRLRDEGQGREAILATWSG